MPVINVGTSPLTSAREWRGVSLVVAARTSGLALGQAEALEAGDLEAFGSVDEMVAVAVLYSATLGIGRDEAMALLDRTIAATAAAEAAYDEVAAAEPFFADPDDTAGEVAGDDRLDTVDATGDHDGVRAFSAAVQGRARTSVPLVGEDLHDDDLLVPMAFENRPQPLDLHVAPLDEADVLPEIEAVPLDGSGSLPVVPHGFDAAVANPDDVVDIDDDGAQDGTGELPAIVAHDPRVQAAIDDDPAWRAAFEKSSGELEAWVSHREGGVGRGTRRLEELSAPVLGRERAEKFAASTAHGAAVVREQLGQVRSRLERSERATLIVAVGAGVVLIALLWLVTSLVGGSDKGATPAPVTPTTTASKQAPATAATKAAGAKQAAATKAAATAAATPVLAIGATHVQVLNAGHRSGVAGATAAKLKGLGYPVGSVGNTHVRYPATVVLYQPKYRREAQRLARQLGTTNVDALPAGTGTSELTYVIV